MKCTPKFFYTFKLTSSQGKHELAYIKLMKLRLNKKYVRFFFFIFFDDTGKLRMGVTVNKANLNNG